MTQRSIRVWFAVAALAALVGCEDSQERAAGYLEAGKERFAAGELDKAAVELRNVLQIDPKNTEAKYYVGLIEERRGNFQRAFQIFNSIAIEQPEDARAHAKVGQFLAAARQLDQAREALGKAQELDPNHPEVVLLEATVLLRDEDFGRASEHARELLAEAPDDGTANSAAIILARALREIGDTEAAISALDEAMEDVKTPTMLRIAKVQLLREAERFDEAVEEYRKLIDADPEEYGYRLTLARLFASEGRLADAETVLREAIAEGVGESAPKFHLVELIANQRGPEAGELELRKLIEESPEEHVLRLRLAGLVLAAEKTAEAEEILKSVADANGYGPHGTGARLGLAHIHLSRNEPEPAAMLIGGILEQDPTNGDALFLRAQMALTANDADAAITDLRTVLRDQPSAKPALVLLERAYLQSGNLELAEETAFRTTEVDPEDTSARLRLATLKAQRGNRPAALELLETVSEADANAEIAAQTLQIRAALLINEEKWEEAEWAIRQLAELPDQESRASYLTGVLNLVRGDQDAAVSAFGEAYELQSTAIEPIRAMVATHLGRGKPEDAVAFLEGVIQDQPDSPVLYNMRAEIEMRQGDMEAASATLERARDLAPDWEVPYVNLSRAYARQDDFQQAIETLDEGLKKRPDSTVLLAARGEIEMRLGRNDDAIATYLKILDADPDNLLAANNAASLIADFAYEDPELFARARELARRLEDVENPMLLDTIGWLHYRAGSLEEARSVLKSAAASLSDNPQVMYHRGMVHYRLGETEAARAALSKAIPEGADYPGIEEARRLHAELSS